MTSKEAIYRELRYGLFLDSLMDTGNIRQEYRSEPSSEYPYIIFRRVTRQVDNIVSVADERFEIEIVFAPSGEIAAESVREAILDHFAGKLQTWGKFTENGTADPTGGLKLKAHYVNTVEVYADNTEEMSKTLLFDFAYLHE